MTNIFLHKIIKAALFISCFFLLACENDTAEVNNFNKKKENGVEEATNIKMNYTVAGKLKAILTAPLMLHVEDTVTYYEFPKTLYAEFYNEKQQKESKLTALYGKYKDAQNIIYLKDSVKIINMLKGDTIYCEDLYWDRSRTGVEFYTNKKVRIRQKDGQYMNGTGMEADQAFKNYHLTNGNGILNSNGNGFPE
ncbi:MAG: LPS export ABC transporter periplasmic protein LptC [Ferruginibacter sp.]|nr:LPS export ABC transporter periplasmic protein LptC [Ferruginibacter sp.]NOU38851.1 LPS export ABC transporter periplasmic protein LptC [Ferruginibacter sp.]